VSGSQKKEGGEGVSPAGVYRGFCEEEKTKVLASDQSLPCRSSILHCGEKNPPPHFLSPPPLPQEDPPHSSSFFADSKLLKF
jgi:hypothetical protein